MDKVISTRRIALITDDPEEAFLFLREKRLTGEKGWDMNMTKFMEYPPETTHKWCVYRITIDN